MKITYRKECDYFLPNLMDEQDRRPIGRWGWMRSEFLRELRPIEFTHLVLSGDYDRILSELNEQAENRLQLLITQMKECEHVTEAMKRVDQMGWVARMNSIRSRAEEIVMNEMIYC